MTEENKKLQWSAEVLDDWYGGTDNPSEKVKNIILDFAKEYHTLKNIESSSCIMHSQPQHNAYYWIKTKDSPRYEVARGRFIGGVGYLISESREVFLPSMLSDWISEPITHP